MLRIFFYQFKGSLVKTPWHVTRTNYFMINNCSSQLSLIFQVILYQLIYLINWNINTMEYDHHSFIPPTESIRETPL